MTPRLERLATIAMQLSAGLVDPAPVMRLPRGVDFRDDDGRDAGRELEWRGRVVRNERRRVCR